MTLPPGLTHIIAQTRLLTDAKRYVILKVAPPHGVDIGALLDPLTSSFSASMFDKDEATLVLSQEAWEQVQPSISVLDMSSPYRLVTFDAPLDFGLVGYLAALSAVLVDVSVSIFALSTFSRDHIFVAEVDFDRAWEALRAYIRSCQAQETTFCDDVESV